LRHAPRWLAAGAHLLSLPPWATLKRCPPIGHSLGYSAEAGRGGVCGFGVRAGKSVPGRSPVHKRVSPKTLRKLVFLVFLSIVSSHFSRLLAGDNKAGLDRQLMLRAWLGEKRLAVD
jgi:hypothetical protein